MTKVEQAKVRAALETVLLYSEPIPEDAKFVAGCDFDRILEETGIERLDCAQDRLAHIMEAFKTSGFQATNLGAAIDEVNRMIEWRPVAGETRMENGEFATTEDEARKKCKIFLGYTSNLVTSGTRDIVRFLVKHRLVDVLVTTAGGVEEDFIKCLAPTLVGDFRLSGEMLRKKGMNRVGNLLIPNNNYCVFEDWLRPILDRMVDEQETRKEVWSPSKMIRRLGQEINDERSIYYWAHRNNIPVFSPAITDGSIGDMVYFHSYAKAGLVLDLVQDIRALNSEAVFAPCTGMIILGGGVVKHHICNANLMRNGADFAVFINTGQEFDGSDSGASPDEAVSWGKIRIGAKPVKVFCDATIAFPLVVAETFAKHVASRRRKDLDVASDALYL